MHNRLVSTEDTLQLQPGNMEAVDNLKIAKDDLRKLQNVKIRGARTRARLTWLEQGDKGSKFFSYFIRNKKAREQIDSICDGGLNISDQEGILKALGFYQILPTFVYFKG